MMNEVTPANGGPETTGRLRPVVAISMGDANGIGPEVTLKCLSDARLMRQVRPLIVGATNVLRRHADAAGLTHLAFIPFETFETFETFGDESRSEAVHVLETGNVLDVRFGRLDAEAGRLAMLCVEKAVDLCLDGTADAMVTAPISKEAVARGGYDVPGHTEFIASRCGTDSFAMMMVAERLRVALVTSHVPIGEVPKRVTLETVSERLRVMDASLRMDFGIHRPRIAVLALNPHAGEGGRMGTEETATIVPAIAVAAREGIEAVGPFPADGFFGASMHLKFDAVLAMYHDQGLVPFKALAFDSGVNFTAGLPIVRTSPDHGTAFDIAGSGTATPDSMRSALYVAVDVARRRRAAIAARP